MAPSSPQDQQPALPAELLLLAESQWLFTDEELTRTPSILDGMPREKERESRAKGVNFILQVGIMLKLPQITLATASVYLHRFYMRHSMVDVPPDRKGLHYYPIAATCLFLATKVEENCRKMRELVIACVRVAQKDPTKLIDEQDKEYWRWRDNILHNEDLLLEAICFDVSLESPYKTLFELLLLLQQENNRPLRNAAWAFVNDSCLTVLCLQFHNRTIAASALYAAAKHCDVSFPDDEYGRPWWEVAGVELSDIRRACNCLADVYEPGQALRSRRSSITYERTSEREEFEKTRAPGADLDSQQSRPTISPSQPTATSTPKRKLEADDEIDATAVNGDSTHEQESNGVLDHSQKHPINGADATSVSPNKRPKIDTGDNQVNETNGVHGNEDNGLVSPKLDEGSEEGEVES
ncbi:MAG: hypothetical protein Q9191_003683 [Dirinaria sp. TL-2023a]